MDEAILTSDLDGGVLTLTFNRPERNNGWVPALEDAFFDALAAGAADPDVRAIVVTGAGRSFCPGLDMDALSQFAGSRDLSLTRGPRRPMTFVLSIPKPVIAAINGACAGIGFIQACCADVRFAARGAKLTTAFARRGLPAENSLSWLLPRLIGHSRAADLLLSARVVTAEEAAAIGLVNHLAEPDQLLPAALAYAHDLADNVSPIAMATTKAQLWDDWQRTQDESRRHSIDLIAELAGHPDLAEGVRSYVEKRPPRFPGLAATVAVAEAAVPSPA